MAWRRTVHIAAGWNRREVPRWLHVLRSLVPAVLYLVVVWTLIVVPRDLLRMNLDPPVPDEVARRAALLAVAAVLAAGSPVVGMWQVYARIRDLATALNGAGRVWTPARFLEELRDTWMDAQRCLGGLSLLVALGTVVTGAFRNTVMAAGYPEKQFPGSTVLLYGTFFTVLGLLVYVPLYMAWKSRVTAFLDQLYPAPEDGKPDEEWSAGRARAQAFVGADGTLAKNLTSAAGILAPLASSVLTVFVPKIG